MDIHFSIPDDSKHNLTPTVHGYAKCEPSYSFGPAVRSYWLVHFVESGTGFFKIENNEYKVCAGEMFIIPPYIETYYEADKSNPWSYIWVGFTAEPELPAELPHILRLPEAAEIFREMRLKSNYESGRNAFLRARLWDLFAVILRKTSTSPDYAEQAVTIIHSEYMHELSVSDIASRLNLNRSYLSDIFKKRMGISPKAYLLSYRMNQAATLLKNSDTTIAITANSVGYNDIYIFSKMFKRHFGVSPSKYKKDFT